MGSFRKRIIKTFLFYGTIHMICPADYFMSEKTKKAFQKSDKLVLEINLADPNEMADMQKHGIGKRTIK